MVFLTSSAPSGAPWADAVSRLVGAGSPMWVRRMIRVGRSASALRRGQRQLDGGEIVAVGHPEHPPAIGLEPAPDVLGEGEGRLAIDGDVIVVVDQRDLAQPQVAGDRRGLAGDSLHHVAIAHESPDPMIDHRVPRPVEVLGQEPLGQGHPDRIADPLAEGTGGRFDAGSVPPLRVARCLRAPLPEIPDVVEAQRIPGQMEQAVEEHRRVAAGEDEAVAVGPVGVLRIVAEKFRPEDVGRRGQGHRRARVAGLSAFDRVHGQHAERVDGRPRMRRAAWRGRIGRLGVEGSGVQGWLRRREVRRAAAGEGLAWDGEKLIKGATRRQPPGSRPGALTAPRRTVYFGPLSVNRITV